MNTNPNTTPKADPAIPFEGVDRKQRKCLATVLRLFLQEELTAFELDELLNDFRVSGDSAVRYVATVVWFHYDDMDDHPVVLAKAQWDFFQRLLLLLESDRRVETTSIQRWSPSHLVAIAALITFLGTAVAWGWGYPLLALLLPLGAISIAIAWLRDRKNAEGINPATFPFATLSDLWSAYDAAAFTKARYPRRREEREIRSWGDDIAADLQCYLAWAVFSPLVLLIQALPSTESRVRVIAR